MLSKTITERYITNKTTEKKLIKQLLDNTKKTHLGLIGTSKYQKTAQKQWQKTFKYGEGIRHPDK